MAEFCQDLLDNWSPQGHGEDCLCQDCLEQKFWQEVNPVNINCSPVESRNAFELVRALRSFRENFVAKKVFTKEWKKLFLTGLKPKKRLLVSLAYIEINQWVDVVKIMSTPVCRPVGVATPMKAGPKT